MIFNSTTMEMGQVNMIYYSQQTQKVFKGLKRNQFTNLSPEQKAIICALLKSKDRAIRLDRNSEDTRYLLSNMLIHQPQQAFTMSCNKDTAVVYAPESWLVDLYTSEPHLFR